MSLGGRTHDYILQRYHHFKVKIAIENPKTMILFTLYVKICFLHYCRKTDADFMIIIVNKYRLMLFVPLLCPKKTQKVVTEVPDTKVP